MRHFPASNEEHDLYARRFWNAAMFLSNVEGARLHRVLLATLLAVLCAASVAKADALFEIGKKACNTLLYGQEPIFGEKYYLRFADLVDIDRGQLCVCVARKFVDNVAEQSLIMERAGDAGEAEAMLQITKSNLDRCLPDFNSLDYATQGMIMRGAAEGSHELATASRRSDDEFEAFRTIDRSLCQKIARSRKAFDRSERDYLSRWERKAGLQAADMCNVCVVEAMHDRRNLLAQDGEFLGADGNASHRSQLVSALMECTQNTFKMPLQ